MSRVLTDEQLARYDADGYLVIEGFADTAACTALSQRAVEMVTEFAPNGPPTLFTTDEQERVADEQFFASANGSWCFFEPEAFDDEGKLRQAATLSVNKIGHAMHDLDPTFESFSYTTDLADVAHDIGIGDALALQSMYLFKQPLIGGEVGCHQDSTFLYTDPLTVTGFWFAIEDATLENGCLWAAPGGHRSNLRSRYVRTGSDESGHVAHFEQLDATPMPAPSTLTPLPVPAGTLVLLHGLLPHWSDVNRSPKSRHAYSLHCISASADYPDWNWLQRSPDLPLRRLDQVASA